MQSCRNFFCSVCCDQNKCLDYINLNLVPIVNLLCNREILNMMINHPNNFLSNRVFIFFYNDI